MTRGPTARRRATKRRALQQMANIDREIVRARQRARCYAEGIGKTCMGVMHDPHELVPVGAGGLRESSNRVGLCRACHREAQNRIGGARLLFDWPGKAEGRAPNADEPGNVTVRWRNAG